MAQLSAYRLRVTSILACTLLFHRHVQGADHTPPQLNYSQANFALSSQAFSFYNIGGEIVVEGHVHRLLNQGDVDFEVSSGQDTLHCASLQCDVCRSTDFECVECKSRRATITMTEDVVFGVCEGHTFDKNGIAEREDEIDCETDDLSGRGLLPSKWKDCFDGDRHKKYFQMGIVMTDRLLNNRFAGNIRHAKVWSSALIAEANLIYSYQLNIELEIGQLYIQKDPNRMKTSCADTWNSKCEDGCLDNLLDQLTDWVECIGDESLGSWQLVDDISNAAGAGVAYVGSVCKPQFNTGVMSFSNGLWRTFAHELGHNFNAWHPLEGGLVKTENAGIMVSRRWIFHKIASRRDLTFETARDMEMESTTVNISLTLGTKAAYVERLTKSSTRARPSRRHHKQYVGTVS